MSSLVTSASLKEFFRMLLEDATGNQRLTLTEVTEFYLVNLLSDFVASDKLFTRDDQGRSDQEPLAFLYQRALHQEREERIRTLRRLGDVSLYRAGFFSGSLQHTAVGADYYIQMGGAAYGQVATLAPSGGFAGVYQELAEKFTRLVDVLEEIAARGLAANGASGTLKVYESWTRTGNASLERVLVDTGVLVKKKGLSN